LEPATETAWLPDLLYDGGSFHSGVALIVSEGRIVRLSRDATDLARSHRLPGRALLPGLVNTHSHSFQRVLRGRTERRSAQSRDTFWTWREAMYHAAERMPPEAVYQAARMVFVEMLLNGITTVGEFHYLHHQPGGVPYKDRNLMARAVLQAAAGTGLRIVLLRTAYARAGAGRPLESTQQRFATPDPEDFLADTEALRNSLPEGAALGVAPHSVRALPAGYLERVAAYARAHALPLHIHAAEQPAEIETCLAEHGLRPVELLAAHGLLDSRTTLIHAIHITTGEIAQLASASARVCACPATERNLGDGIVDARSLLAAGVPICLGSDSHAQIDLLEDARELELHLRLTRLERAVLAPDASAGSLAARLFACATQAGAQSLGVPADAADFFTVSLDDPALAGADAETLLSHIIFAAGRPAIREVFVSGKPVVVDGHHPLETEVTREFAALQRELWRNAP
jgi:formimidoylglutamate deiminase